MLPVELPEVGEGKDEAIFLDGVCCLILHILTLF